MAGVVDYTGYAPLSVPNIRDSCSTSPGMRPRSGSIEHESGKARLRRIANRKSTTIVPGARPEKIEPREAMAQLIAHLRFDPDGGLTNLNDEELASGSAQVSKIPAIRKSGLEMMLAVIAVLRAVMNSGYIFHHSSPIIYGYLSSEEYRLAMHESHRQVHVDLPMTALTVAVHLVELSVMIILVLHFLWQGACVVVHFQNKDKKYLHVSRAFWTYLPMIQTFSAIRALAYVHPNLIKKNAKNFSLHEQAARAILERFLRVDREESTPELLLEGFARIMIQHKHKDEDEETRLEHASEYVNMTEYGAVQSLMSSLTAHGAAELMTMVKEENGSKAATPRTPGNPDGDDQFFVCGNLDPSALGVGWRLSLLVLAEHMGFLFIAFAALCLGFVAVLVKLCHAVVIFTAPEPESETLHLLFWAACFTNQIMSIAAVQQLLMWRVQVFVFGGSDATISREEAFVIQIYLAHLMEKVWQSQALGFSQKLTISLTLDDDNLQKLIVEEDFHQKAACTVAVSRFMTDQGHDSRSIIAEWVRGTEAKAARV